jgi:enoyl-CoA hydratase/carnithine racemase
MESAPRYALSVEDTGKVRVVTLDRPEKLNAFTAEGYRLLRAELEKAAADPAVSVVVLTGRGRAFSAGVDLNEMSRPGGSTELGTDFDPLLAALAGFPKPLLAAVNGTAVGFGATILLHCDLVVIDETAQVRMPFITLGTCAEAASSWLLPQRVGMQQASWMVLSGAPITADDAVRVGFALATAPAGRAVEETVALGERLAANHTAALIANKRLLRTGWVQTIDEVWEREKAEMVSIAGELGSIGWQRR